MIYISSDLHLCHDRDFVYQPRGFKSVDEMNETIIKNFCKTLTYDDDLYLLGDECLNDNEKAKKYLAQIRCKVHFIQGNHDSNTRVEMYEKLGWENLGGAAFLKYKGYSFYLSHYPTLCSNGDETKPLKGRVINICGHTHTKDPFLDWDKGLIFHAEVDTNNCQPWNISEILRQIQEKVKKD